MTIDEKAPKELLKLLKIFEDNGIKITFWNPQSKGCIYTITAAADDTVTKDPTMLVTGSASSLSPIDAAYRALIEVAQRRASKLHGENELKDANHRSLLEKAGYDRIKRINSFWFDETAPSVNLSDLEDESTESVDSDIRKIIDSFLGITDYIFVVDLTKTYSPEDNPENKVSIPAVRVVIPGFELSYVDPSRVKQTE